VAFGAAAVASACGALATDIGPWYQALHKPAWQPPDWLFGPVWTTIFVLTACSAVLAWRHAAGPGRSRIAQLFGLNLMLNVGWSLLFFRLRRPDFALIEVLALWASVLVLVVWTWTCSRTASALLLPYLAWVSFAAFLNLTLVRLNSPFASA
jgi:tryptophan-rich sensory protein